jgi:hypothetical protein
MKRLYKSLVVLAVFMLPFSAEVATSVGPSEPNPIFSQDLRPFGFITDTSGPKPANYADINFLSPDMVLVSVNYRYFGRSEKLFSDQPPSKLLLFDISHKRLEKTIEMQVEKFAGSVRAVGDGQFVLLNETGLLLCSLELECGLPFHTVGPLFVSPRGTRIVVGGNRRTEQKLLDAISFKQIEAFPWSNWKVIPGDEGILIHDGGKLCLRMPGRADQPLPLGEALFLNNTSIVGFEPGYKLAVSKTDGTILFEVPISHKSQESKIVTAASGSRFCYHHTEYSGWNSALNPLDFDQTRPANFESVKVLSSESGAVLLDLHWDPRPYIGTLTLPALSPDGKRLAMIRHGFLEIVEIP